MPNIIRIKKKLYVSKAEIQAGFGEAKMEQIATTQSLKRRFKCDALENLKRKKNDLEKTMNDLRNDFENETLKEDKNYLSAMSKATSFLRAVKEKENTLTELYKADKHIGKDIKQM